jgi:hypothetical protein
LSTGKTKCEQQQQDLDVKISLLSEASAKVATKRMEKLTHYYPDFIRAQSLVHVNFSHLSIVMFYALWHLFVKFVCLCWIFVLLPFSCYK